MWNSCFFSPWHNFLSCLCVGISKTRMCSGQRSVNWFAVTSLTGPWWAHKTQTFYEAKLNLIIWLGQVPFEYGMSHQHKSSLVNPTSSLSDRVCSFYFHWIIWCIAPSCPSPVNCHMLGFPLQQIEHEDVIERVSVISDGGLCWVGQGADVNILLISIKDEAGISPI